MYFSGTWLFVVVIVLYSVKPFIFVLYPSAIEFFFNVIVTWVHVIPVRSVYKAHSWAVTAQRHDESGEKDTDRLTAQASDMAGFTAAWRPFVSFSPCSFPSFEKRPERHVGNISGISFKSDTDGRWWLEKSGQEQRFMGWKISFQSCSIFSFRKKERQKDRKWNEKKWVVLTRAAREGQLELGLV